ncbi:MAG TPA: AAA family ATPase, partial [Patescibacteria group bacterium]|nr:AAA family ATPase [Patescibacteria group bacterium]
LSQLIRCERVYRESQRRIQEIEEIIQGIYDDQKVSYGGAVKGAAREQVKLLEDERNRIIKEKIEPFDQYTAGYELRRYFDIGAFADQLSKGHIIEIPSARVVIDEGLEHMRNHQPFLLAGHLGSGKTEMARHMAKLFMIENGVGYDLEEELAQMKKKDKTADTNKVYDQIYDKLSVEIFSGGEEASVYDLIGKLKLVAKGADKKDLVKHINALSETLEKAGITEVPRDQIAAILLGKSDATETVFNYGPLGRALRDGKPIIIDEINLMPPEIIARINDIMLRKTGDRVRLQENGEEEFTVKPGFAILATCNLGTQYAGIKEVNAAFKSRWIAKEVGYPTVAETYDLILASLVRKDRVRLPPDFPEEAFEMLARLAVVTREVQELFSKQTQGVRFMMPNAIAGEPAQLEKAVISTRDLMRKIMLPWKQKNFTVSLDAVIAKNILAAEVFSIDDQKLMAEIFIRCGFFKTWKEAQFKKIGIFTISQKELDDLQATMQTEDYLKANDAMDKLLKTAEENAAKMGTGLMVGNIGRQKKVAERLDQASAA